MEAGWYRSKVIHCPTVDLPVRTTRNELLEVMRLAVRYHLSRSEITVHLNDLPPAVTTIVLAVASGGGPMGQS